MKFTPSAFYLAVLLMAAATTESSAFVAPSAAAVRTNILPQNNNIGFRLMSSSSSSDTAETKDLGLTPELQKLTDAFENIGDDKLRYKQLLYMASNGLDPMPDALKVDENKVLGCLSTVHVHATKDADGLVSFTGDSDGLLTKGLVALLVRYVQSVV